MATRAPLTLADKERIYAARLNRRFLAFASYGDQVHSYTMTRSCIFVVACAIRQKSLL
jgi:hypothetical protein